MKEETKSVIIDMTSKFIGSKIAHITLSILLRYHHLGLSHLVADVINIDTSGISALEEIYKKLASASVQVRGKKKK